MPRDWLQQLTEPPAGLARTGLPGLSTGGDWASTRRLLEGRRLLTLADDPRFARLHRVLAEHLSSRLADPDTQDRLDTHLQQLSQELAEAATPDTALLAVTAATLTARLADGRHELADAGHGLIDQAEQRLDLDSTNSLAAATLRTREHHAAADPADSELQRDVSVSLEKVGSLRAACGDTAGAVATIPVPCASTSGSPPKTPPTPATSAVWPLACGQGG